MDCIVDADASPVAHFALPEGFSVDWHFEGAFGVHAGDAARSRVVIDFDASVADYVQSRQFPGEDGEPAVVEPLPGGGVRLRMVVGATTEVRRGSCRSATRPASSSRRTSPSVTAELRGALALYGATSPSRSKSAGFRGKRPPPA